MTWEVWGAAKNSIQPGFSGTFLVLYVLKNSSSYPAILFGTPNAVSLLTIHTNTTPDIAYEHLDFPAVVVNTCRSTTTINQPLTPWNRKGGESRLVIESGLSLRKTRNGYEKKNQSVDWASSVQHSSRYCSTFLYLSSFLFGLSSCTNDRLCGLVVRVSGYWYRGPGFDPRHYQIFWVVVGLERGPLSLVRSNWGATWIKK